MKFLFLDYDGVLHPSFVYQHPRTFQPFLDELLVKEGHTLFEHASLLERILDECGVPVKIVLSTSWVRQLQFNKARRYLTVGLKRRVVGATWHSSMTNSLGTLDSDPLGKPFTSINRFEQIHSHCLRNHIKPSEWLAIDDDFFGWDERFRENLIQTDEILGLGKIETQEELIQKLRAKW